ncbi:MAG: D-glycero-beta-D-manno-heptose 1,7-bisphosphate 7-phosphatase [Chloroflexi bacterium]|nr:D-glycero-beta-D-manno-heptose 1,7-bisphosphate 7-phosphatase [Chloroflexota bacterium]
MGFRAVFIDRDGTISEDVNYCSSVEDFHILPTVPEAIRLLNDVGFKVVLITNQSGISRGYFTEAILAEIHAKMESELVKYGAYIDAIYYCPHQPDDGCGCRKPKPGLLTKAAEELGIDLKFSYMIGDMQKDIDVGRAVGCKTILVTTGPDGGDGVTNADYTADSLSQAAQWIIENA